MARTPTNIVIEQAIPGGWAKLEDQPANLTSIPAALKHLKTLPAKTYRLVRPVLVVNVARPMVEQLTLSVSKAG